MLKKISDKLLGLAICEKRCVTDDFCELVFLKKDLASWEEALKGELGPAAKPIGEAPTKEDSALTEAYGGIYKNQVLYRKACGEGTVIVAMLWPWQDGAHITLRLFIKKHEMEKGDQKPFWKKIF